MALDYSLIKQKTYQVVGGFTNTKIDDSNAGSLTIGGLGLSGNQNAYDPIARYRALCQELKTSFHKASGGLPALHLNLEPETIRDNPEWTIEKLAKRVSRSLYSLVKEVAQ